MWPTSGLHFVSLSLSFSLYLFRYSYSVYSPYQMKILRPLSFSRVKERRKKSLFKKRDDYKGCGGHLVTINWHLWLGPFGRWAVSSLVISRDYSFGNRLFIGWRSFYTARHRQSSASTHVDTTAAELMQRPAYCLARQTRNTHTHTALLVCWPGGCQSIFSSFFLCQKEGKKRISTKKRIERNPMFRQRS